MSLQVWLPLNGDLIQQGLSNATATNHGATVNNNGKIGKCYQNTASNYITIPVTINVKQPFSLCYWYRIDTWKNWGTTITLNTANEDYVGMCPSSDGTSIGTNWYELRNGTSTRIFDSYHSNTITVGQWNHIAIVFDGVNNIKTYINGMLVSNGTVATSPLANFTELTLFRRGRNATYGHSSLNDVRVYDHALSIKEVQELAKGLVLHYRLAGPGQENLIKNSQLATSWGANRVCTCNSPTGYSFDGECVKITSGTAGNQNNGYGIFLSTSDISYSVGEKLTFSVDIKGSGEHIALWFLGADGNWWTGANFHTYFTQYDDWTRLFVTGTVPSGAPKMMLGLHAGLSNNTLYAKNMKLERGSVQTPWTPNPSDTLWTTMGYSNNIEYDCSGFGYNGTKAGNITWNVDSPRYTTSYRFPSYTSGIQCNNILNLNDSYSISFWVKMNTITTSTENVFVGLYLGRNEGRTLINKQSNRNTFSFWVGDSTNVQVNSTTTLATGKWYHVVGTKDKSHVLRLYINGVQEGGTVTNANSGKDSRPNVGSINYTSSGYNGDYNMADVRIYATALSAEDIQELYHSAVIIDNTGKSYAYEYFEG